MKKLFVLLLLTTAICSAQVVVAPQYTVNLNFLTGGIYGQTSAIDTVFGTQLTTNTQLEADVLAAPGGGVTDYEGGANYNLCGISALEKLLASTSLSCGKIEPFAAFAAGLGRVQQGGSPSTESFAYIAKAGISLPSASGAYALAFVGGYGKFGPPIAGQSNQGFVFNTGVTFGGGNSAEATAAKVARIQRAQAKKQRKLEKQREKDAKTVF
jgi:hypothetical protein